MPVSVSNDAFVAERHSHSQDLNSKFTILLGEVRTEIEATKWISTRALICLPLPWPCSVLTLPILAGRSRNEYVSLPTRSCPCHIRAQLTLVFLLSTAAIVAVVVCVVAYVSAAPSKPKDPPPPPPSIEELGVRRGSEEAEVAPPGGWGFWSATPAATTGQSQKRVGSEEEGEEGR